MGGRLRAHSSREAHFQFRQRPDGGARHRGIRIIRLALQLDANLVGLVLIAQARKGLNHLDPRFLFRALQQGQQQLHRFGVAELADGPHHHGNLLGGAPAQHLVHARHGAFAADFRQRIDRALADPPVAVPGGLDQVIDGALVLGLVQDFDGGAPDVIVLVAHQLQHGFDHPRPADLPERIGRAAAYPPVAVLQRIQQVLHRFGVADLVEDLDRGAARVLVLILQDLDQVADRVGMIRLDDDIDGLVLHVDLGILEQRADALDVDRTVHSLQRGERGAADELVGIFELSLQRRLHFGRIEPRQQIYDVHACDRVFAPHAADEFRNGTGVRDLAHDPEEGSLLVRLLLIGRRQKLTDAEPRLLSRNHFKDRRLGNPRRGQRLDEQVRRIVAVAGERP